MSCGCGIFLKVTSATFLKTNPLSTTSITRWGNKIGRQNRVLFCRKKKNSKWKNLLLVLNKISNFLESLLLCHFLLVTFFTSIAADSPWNRWLIRKLIHFTLLLHVTAVHFPWFNFKLLESIVVIKRLCCHAMSVCMSRSRVTTCNI